MAKFLDIFKKLEITLPFGEALQQMPLYAKILKDMLIKKNRYIHSDKMLWKVSYPNFVQGLLLDDMQPLIGRFEILGILCCTICEVPRHAGNQKDAGLRDP